MSKLKRTQAREEKSRAAKKNKKINIFPCILCFLIAFIIWLYASNLEKRDKDAMNVNTNTQAAAVVALPETL